MLTHTYTKYIVSVKEEITCHSPLTRAGAGRLRAAWDSQEVLGQTGLYDKTLSQRKVATPGTGGVTQWWSMGHKALGSVSSVVKKEKTLKCVLYEEG